MAQPVEETGALVAVLPRLSRAVTTMADALPPCQFTKPLSFSCYAMLEQHHVFGRPGGAHQTPHACSAITVTYGL